MTDTVLLYLCREILIHPPHFNLLIYNSNPNREVCSFAIISSLNLHYGKRNRPYILLVSFLIKVWQLNLRQHEEENLSFRTGERNDFLILNSDGISFSFSILAKNKNHRFLTKKLQPADFSFINTIWCFLYLTFYVDKCATLKVLFCLNSLHWLECLLQFSSHFFISPIYFSTGKYKFD